MAAHGNSNRGLEAGANPDVAFGRFGQMFDLKPASRLPEEGLLDIAMAMIKTDPGKGIKDSEMIDENPTIPAGYTYFGQFIDHDLTLDTTPLSDAEIDVSALVDFRSAALDLDCVYGRGPDDQPYLYDGLKLRVGRKMGSAGATIGTRNDLLRLTESVPPAKDGREGVPLLGDKRNDENKIVSQIHGALIAFHNKVVGQDALLTAFGGDISSPASRFRAAAMLVRWHYQWVVVHDYLDRICEPCMKNEVLNPGGSPRLLHYRKQAAQYAYIPVEFSGAAFRFGHSMVRPSYALNFAVGTDNADTRIPLFSHAADPTKNLNGFPGTLPDDWGVDWGYFLDGDLKPNIGPDFKVPQPSYRIDALLVDPLADLPEFRDKGSPFVNLAFRNLERGQMLGLPSGQAVATELGIVPLPDEILWDAGSSQRDRTKLDAGDTADFEKVRAARAAVRAKWADNNGCKLKGSTPLWYYILREAEYYGVTKDPNEPGVGLGGQHLGPVGSRIVAETLIGLLWYDKNSFLHNTRGFKPMKPIASDPENFTLDQLIRYALT